MPPRTHAPASLSIPLAILAVAAAATLAAPATTAGAIDFAQPIRLDAGDSPSALTAGDLDGNGTADLVAVHRTSDDAWVWLGDGAGGFTPVGSFAVGPFPQGVVLAHLDGDGILDLATTAVEFSDGAIVAWLGNGDGTFALSQELVADDGTRAIAAVDLDGDGRLDLIATNPTRGNLSAYLGDGAGGFGDELRSTAGTASSYPTDLAVVDLDGDGNLDVTTSNAQSSDASVGRLRGDGDGTFETPVAFPTTCMRPESIAAGDFDRDGRADLAVVCFQSAEVAVLLGDGAGGFAPPALHDLGMDVGNPYWVLVVDLDRDARADLVTANNGSFSVLRGRGDGTFEAAQVVESVPGTFFGATATDVDGDGWPDLAFADFGQDQVAIFLNRTGACGGDDCPLKLTASPAGEGTATALAWSPAAGALGYDTVRGDLAALLSTGGSFAAATTGCLGQTVVAAIEDSQLPDPGAGFWYLVRERTAAGAGSFDAFAGNLAAPRDSSVAASGVGCP